MESQVKQGRRGSKEGQELRALIDLVLSFPLASRFYWISALVKQGQIEESTAGRLIMAEGV